MKPIPVEIVIKRLRKSLAAEGQQLGIELGAAASDLENYTITDAESGRLIAWGADAVMGWARETGALRTGEYIQD